MNFVICFLLGGIAVCSFITCQTCISILNLIKKNL